MDNVWRGPLKILVIYMPHVKQTGIKTFYIKILMVYLIISLVDKEWVTYESTE